MDLNKIRSKANEVLANDTWGDVDGESYDPNALAKLTLELLDKYEQLLLENQKK